MPHCRSFALITSINHPSKFYMYNSELFPHHYNSAYPPETFIIASKMFLNLNLSGKIKYLSLNVSEYKHNTNSSAGRQFLSVCNLCNQLKNAIAIHGFSYSFMTHVCLEQMSSQVSENENTLKVRYANLGNFICCRVHIQDTLKAKRGSYPILYCRTSLAGLFSKQ